MLATLVRSKKIQTSDFSLRKHQTIGAAVATLAATEGRQLDELPTKRVHQSAPR
jgi:hypothetical protein